MAAPRMPTVIDGAGDEYEVEWAEITFHLRHVETGLRVSASQYTIIKLGESRAAIVAALEGRRLAPSLDADQP
jgi:hypothetical protein